MTRKYRVVRLLPLGATEIIVAADVVCFDGGEILVAGSATHDTRAKSSACLWDANGRPTTLEGIAGYSRGMVVEIVSPRQFVGHCCDHIGGEKRFGAATWSPDGVEELPTLAGHDSATAHSGNPRGLVAGQSFHSDVELEGAATVWFAGSAVSREPSDDFGYPTSVIRSINRNNVGVGKLSNADKSSAIGVWNKNLVLVLQLEDSTQGGAYDITDSNLLLGQIGRDDHGHTAVWQLLFDEDGQLQANLPVAKLAPPEMGIQSAPVLDDSDMIRVAYNAMIVGGTNAGVPAPYLFEARTLEELAQAVPVDVNKLVNPPMPWDRIEAVMGITSGGIMVAHAHYGTEESAMLIIPED